MQEYFVVLDPTQNFMEEILTLHSCLGCNIPVPTIGQRLFRPLVTAELC